MSAAVHLGSYYCLTVQISARLVSQILVVVGNISTGIATGNFKGDQD